jgi:multidrug efflux pump subunit AcrA (membrane-fusion protein)
MNLFIKRLAIAFLLIPLFIGCGSVKESNEEENIRVVIPVNTTNVSEEKIVVYQTLNGVVQFQKKDNIRSNTTGYISSLDFIQGSAIKKGDLFCTVKTKEQSALGESNTKDSTLSKFTKPIVVYSNSSGIISSIPVVQGDYIAEGDVLATVLEPNSLVVVVYVPFEYHTTISKGLICEITLPDSKKFNEPISGMMPTVDSISQSQKYFIRIKDISLPEKLNVTVKFPVEQASKALCVPISAVQTDEQQKEFWVMKVVQDTLAVKVPVVLGLRSDSIAQISSPFIKLNDLVVTKGSYELADSSIVKISKR